MARPVYRCEVDDATCRRRLTDTRSDLEPWFSPDGGDGRSANTPSSSRWPFHGGRPVSSIAIPLPFLRLLAPRAFRSPGVALPLLVSARRRAPGDASSPVVEFF
ncbi:MAG: hypothetical protein D6723_11055 [Acidobacteria bacterium]|nr:MAG: hypothetical protein D6723_11055 [Acidobacteriota bacterium]